jgi:hypothetical protein
MDTLVELLSVKVNDTAEPADELRPDRPPQESSLAPLTVKPKVVGAGGAVVCECVGAGAGLRLWVGVGAGAVDADVVLGMAAGVVVGASGVVAWLSGDDFLVALPVAFLVALADALAVADARAVAEGTADDVESPAAVVIDTATGWPVTEGL